jgi:hypothetical protein
MLHISHHASINPLLQGFPYTAQLVYVNLTAFTVRIVANPSCDASFGCCQTTFKKVEFIIKGVSEGYVMHAALLCDASLALATSLPVMCDVLLTVTISLVVCLQITAAVPLTRLPPPAHPSP